jgi:hypothetical protein
VLVVASAVIRGSESLGAHDHILLTLIRDSPNLEGRVPSLYPPGTRRPGYTRRHWVPFSSPPVTRRATVEVFERASTRAAPTAYPHSCSLATAAVLSPVYTAVTWQWVYMSQYASRYVRFEVLTSSGPPIGHTYLLHPSSPAYFNPLQVSYSPCSCVCVPIHLSAVQIGPLGLHLHPCLYSGKRDHVTILRGAGIAAIGVRFPAGARDFLYSLASRQVLWPTQPPIQ